MQLRTRDKPFVLPVEIFEHLFATLSRERFAVQEIEYCGQGEPLMNPRFATLVERGRHHFPHAHQRLITNGNFDYQRTVRGQFLDEIMVSCDGFHPSSYARYRIGGEVRKPLSFMRAARSSGDSSRQRVIWKYILFEFNDSDEEIEAAQRAAQDLGVTALLFVVTHSQYKSRRYTSDNLATLPRLYPNVVLNLTPLLHSRSVSFAARCDDDISRGELRPVYEQEEYRVFARLDEVSLSLDQHLNLRGWALAPNGITRVDVELDGVPIGMARLGGARGDVLRALPMYGRADSGFTLSVALGRVLHGRHAVALVLHTSDARQVEARFDYDFDAPVHSAAGRADRDGNARTPSPSW